MTAVCEGRRRATPVKSFYFPRRHLSSCSMNMDIGMTAVWTSVVLLLLDHCSSAAEFSPLSCNVTRLMNRTFRYQLSESSWSTCSRTYWEDINKTVIVFNSDSNEKLVANLLSNLVDLKVCRDFLLYWRDCSGIKQEVECRVNCSELEDLHPPIGFCLTKHLCTEELTGGLIIGGIFLLLLVVLVWFHVCKCRRPTRVKASYSAPKEKKQGTSLKSHIREE